MGAFIRDMIIGWIIYTESGKKMANKVFNITYNNIKKNIVPVKEEKNESRQSTKH